MSASLLNAAWGAMAEHAPSERLVLLYYAWRANADGYWQCSVSKVIAETGLSERAVHLAIHNLITRGCLLPASDPQKTGRGQTVLYRVSVAGVSTPPVKGADYGVSTPSGKGAESAQKGANSAPKGANSAVLAPERVQSLQGVNGFDFDSRVLEKQNQQNKPQIKTHRASAPSPWEVISAELKKIVNPHRYDTWIKPLRFVGVADGALILKAPSPGYQDAAEALSGEFRKAIEKSGLNGIASIRIDAPEEQRARVTTPNLGAMVPAGNARGRRA